MTITTEKAVLLPLHDARIYCVNIELAENGTVNASIELQIHSDESPELFKQLGIVSSKLRLVFSDCLRITTDLFGFCSPQEAVGTFDIVNPSNLLQEMTTLGLAKQPMTHFHILGSSGTQLHFLAKSISVIAK